MNCKHLLAGLLFLLISGGASAATIEDEGAQAPTDDASTEATKEAEEKNPVEDIADETPEDSADNPTENTTEETTKNTEVELDPLKDNTKDTTADNKELDDTTPKDTAKEIAPDLAAENQTPDEDKTPPLPNSWLNTIESADALISAEFLRHVAPSSNLEFTIKEVLKGELTPSEKIVVDFERASYALWPTSGTTLLCISHNKLTDTWGLTSYTSAIISPQFLEAVKTALQEKRAEIKATEMPELSKEELAVRKRMGNATTVLLGRIESPEDADEEDAGAKKDKQSDDEQFMSFLAEEAILGFDGFFEPIKIAMPKTGGLLPGPYILFLRGASDGNYFVLADTDPVVALNPDAPEDTPELATIKETLRTVNIRFCTPQATFTEYQNAWNERDLPRLIGTYTPQSPFSIQYKQGGDARKALLDQIESFPARIHLSIEKITIESAPDKPKLARIASTLSIILPSENQKNKVEVVLANIDGNWLITSEGF